MVNEISEMIERFRKAGEYSILAEMDKLPHERFKHPQIQQKAFMKTQSRHSLGFTCYQHAMAYVLDQFHPGIVAYIESEFSKDTYNADDHFIRILDSMLEEASRFEFGYSDLAAAPETKMDIFAKVNALESVIESSGYVIALGDFHGEAYVFHQNGEIPNLTLIHHRSIEPVTLWKKGNAQAWHQENRNRSRVISNDHILEYDILSEESPDQLSTKFVSRNELQHAFSTQAVLRGIVQEEARKYLSSQSHF